MHKITCIQYVLYFFWFNCVLYLLFILSRIILYGKVFTYTYNIFRNYICLVHYRNFNFHIIRRIFLVSYVLIRYGGYTYNAPVSHVAVKRVQPYTYNQVFIYIKFK